jgi:hypothetical protein
MATPAGADSFFNGLCHHQRCGELEAMALYQTVAADLLLVDDARAKKIAYLNGLETMGSVGVLLLAKRRGLISQLKPFLDILTASYEGNGYE